MPKAKNTNAIRRRGKTAALDSDAAPPLSRARHAAQVAQSRSLVGELYGCLCHRASDDEAQLDHGYSTPRRPDRGG